MSPASPPPPSRSSSIEAAGRASGPAGGPAIVAGVAPGDAPGAAASPDNGGSTGVVGSGAVPGDGLGAAPGSHIAGRAVASASARPSPGVATVARVDATRSWRRVTVDAGGDGWFRLADRLADPAGLDAWYAAEVAGTGRGHRDLAGALIVYRFSGSLAELVVGPLLEQRRVVVLSPGNLSLRLGENARIESLSVTAPVVAVLADDPDAGRPGTVVVGPASGRTGSPGTASAAGPSGAAGTSGTDALAALREVAVDGLLAVFGALAEAVRARAPFGLRGMWGTLADHLADVALRRARDRGSDGEAAWATASALVDDLAARQPLLRARPTRHEVVCAAGAGLFATKGTCCLIYKTNMPADRAEGRGSAQPWIDADACTSCPLRSEPDRTARLVRYLTDRAERINRG